MSWVPSVPASSCFWDGLDIACSRYFPTPFRVSMREVRQGIFPRIQWFFLEAVSVTVECIFLTYEMKGSELSMYSIPTCRIRLLLVCLLRRTEPGPALLLICLVMVLRCGRVLSTELSTVPLLSLGSSPFPPAVRKPARKGCPRGLNHNAGPPP